MPSVSLEAAHPYISYYNAHQLWANKNPGEDEPDFEHIETPELANGLLLGIKISNLLETRGHKLTRVVFADDFQFQNDLAKTKDPWRAQLFAHRGIRQYEPAGYTPLTIVYESNFGHEAKVLVGVLSQLSVFDPHSQTITTSIGKKKYRVKLYSDVDPNRPSCEIYDAVCYQHKLNQQKLAITILPKNFHSQQNRVKAIFSLLGELPPVVVIYFDDSGTVITVDHWNPAQTKTILDEVSLLGMKASAADMAQKG